VDAPANLQRALDFCERALDELGRDVPETDAAKVLIEATRTELLAIAANEDAGLATSR